MELCQHLYRADQVRELDSLAIERHGIDGYALMTRAAEAAFSVLKANWPEAISLSVCCGGGNNGGDGYVLARLAHHAGIAVQLITLKPPDELSGDAARAAAEWIRADGAVSEPGPALSGEVIVDAMLGTGLDRPPAPMPR